MRVLCGTSGFSYKEWKGHFYPEDLPAKQMLSYYAGRLPVVEINNTFYRMPKAEILQKWTEQVPEHFVFVIKASRRITHAKGRLKEVDDSVTYLWDQVQSLDSHLGPILFQLPPNLKVDVERLERFLEVLPEATPAAFEFRHESWADEAVHGLLRDRNCPWVQVDDEGGPASDLISTADWGYLRLRRETYNDDELAAWAERVRQQPWQEVFVFFKHEDEGTAPRLAEKFASLLTGT